MAKSKIPPRMSAAAKRPAASSTPPMMPGMGGMMAGAGKTDAKKMPFTAYMESRTSGKGGTGSNSAKMLRDRAARLRAKAHARSAAHEMS